MASTISAGTTSGTALNMAGDTSGSLQLQTNGTTTAVTISTAQTTTLNSAASTAPLIAQINGTEAMRVDSAGNLLVGTATNGTVSGTLLSVGGTGNRYIDVTGGGASANGGLLLGGNSANNQANVIWVTASNYVQLASSPAGSQVRCIAGGSGGVYLAATATAWASLSDETTKTDLKPIENAVDKVNQLRSVTGRYKTDDEGTSRSFLIAQDVQKVLPEAVNEQETGVLGLQYTDVIPLLVASIKELNAKVDAQAAEIQALKGTA